MMGSGDMNDDDVYEAGCCLFMLTLYFYSEYRTLKKFRFSETKTNDSSIILFFTTRSIMLSPIIVSH